MKAILAVVAACLLLAGPARAYEIVEIDNGGTLRGVITTTAAGTNDQTIEITKDKVVCHESVPNEGVLVGENGGLAQAVVCLVGVAAGKNPDSMPEPVLSNVGCRYEPHVQAMMVGERLVITNEDPILHNTHARDATEKTVFNFALPIQGQRIKKKIKKPGILEAKCDAGHTWMNGYVFVHENPYYAVTDADGGFEIAQVPAGEYTLKVWHPALGETEKKLTIAAGETATVKLRLGE
jgi:hypothetical protein